MKTKYRSTTLAWKVLLCCFMCGAFSLGFFCGLLNSHWISVNYRSEADIEPTVRPKIKLTPMICTSMIVVILSSPTNVLQRKVIRKTWLQTANGKPIRHLFVLGGAARDAKEREDLDAERDRYKDLLILEDFKDSYHILSDKVLQSFSWISDNVDFTFLLKLDDDSFVQLGELHSQLTSRNRTTGLYLGFFDGRARVKKKGRWSETSWFLCDRYLPYAQGGGYVVTADLVRYIANNRAVLQKYRNEDVSMGVWLAPVRLTRIHDTNFDTEYQSRGCFNSYVVTHKQSPQQMIDKYNNLVKYGSICESEFRSRKSYIYNWNVVPSLCCQRNNSSVP